MGLNYDFDPEDPNLKLTTAERVRMRAAAAAERKAKYFPVQRPQLALEAPAEETIEVEATAEPGIGPAPTKPNLPYGPPIWMRQSLKIPDIVSIAARAAGVSEKEIRSSSRKRKFVIPRQIVMVAASIWTSNSGPEIGRRLGGKDHTTVMHSIHQVLLKRAAGDPDYLRISEEVAWHLNRVWPEPTEQELAAARRWKSNRTVHRPGGHIRNGRVVGGYTQGLVL